MSRSVTRACVILLKYKVNTVFESANIRNFTFRGLAGDDRVSNGDRGRQNITQECATTKICLVGPLNVSVAQGLLPVGMATSHCSVGVAVDAVLVMVAEVTVSRPDAFQFFE